MVMNDNLFWCNFDPNRVWRAPTPKTTPEISVNDENREVGKPDPSLMMRLTHNTSYISLSALEQQPCGSSATIFPPVSSPQHRQRRPVAPLEDQLLENMQNVTVNDYDFISLGITPVNMNPWQPNSMSFGTASTNGFTGSDTSSAPMSPISSPGLRKNYGTQGNGYHQQTQKSFYKSPTHPNHFRNNRNVNGGSSQQNGFHNGQHYQNRNGFNGNNVQHTVAPTVRTLRNTEDYKPGMRDLGYWLKKLRLHKYAPLFEDMTYRQLLNVNDEVLERMKVTNGARKKISQSIEKLHERPELLRSLEQKMKNGSQCVRCAICSIRQLLWSPFIKYDGGNRKTSADIIDGFNVPSQMISDDNIPALVFRCIEILNNMVFPLRKGLQDLEDEYQLTMFHMFESVMKNEAFTPNQQRRAYIMKKNARNYANPEEIRRHRMGMVSSSQCEGCHHAEVVNRERLMELQDRQARQARGDPVGLSLTSCTAILDLRSSNMNGRLEYNVPPAPVPAQRIQKRPAFSGDIEDEWDGSPKITAPSSSPPDSVIFESLVLPQMKSSHFWSNVENIWGDDGNKPSTSFRFPMYRRPEEMDESSNTESPVNNEDEFTFLEMVSEKQPSKDLSLSDFAFPEASSKKANSTGSGCSSSESEVSIVTSPCASMTGTEDEPILYGVNQILYPSSPFERNFSE